MIEDELRVQQMSALMDTVIDTLGSPRPRAAQTASHHCGAGPQTADSRLDFDRDAQATGI